MGIRLFTASGFRCLEDVRVEFDPRYNLIHGANASGKTSLLEALVYLGRGKSFRGAPTTSVVRHGAKEFVLFGKVDHGDRELSVGVRNGRRGLETKVDGDDGGGTAALAEAFPVQVIDPEVHRLIAGGPEERRRFLDWVVFHVEHEYLNVWRRFRRVLKQRNALLKGRVGPRELAGWDEEFVAAAEGVNMLRSQVLERALPAIRSAGEAMLGGPVDVLYRRGWPADTGLADALVEQRERELHLGGSQVGPHRADLSIRTDERQAKRLVSRGQQKLLASALIIGGMEFAKQETGIHSTLLLDDPAAELDSESLRRIMGSAVALGSQLIVTSLNPELIEFPAAPRVFHVEHGKIDLEQT